MLNKIVKTDKYGNTLINYRLTQGDTFGVELVVKTPEQVIVSSAEVEKVKFKLSDTDYNLIYEQDFVYNPTTQKYSITIPTEVTSTWAVDTYIYEYEVTFVGNIIDTPMQANFTVTDQIIGGENNG